MTAQTMVEEVNRDELKYLDQIREIIENGKLRTDRTGTGTLSIFGMQSRYSLRNEAVAIHRGIMHLNRVKHLLFVKTGLSPGRAGKTLKGVVPLLTTKRVYWKGIVEELLWFIRADTNSNHLSEKNVKIWDANGSREFLDSLGFTDREQGDLGPVYGFQWRHFGARYKGPNADYKGEGVDQLAEVIHQIKTNPDSRRIILSAWNPLDLEIMALPPCHTLCQFYVQDGELSCQLYQRSGDMGLGVPFNIASYGLFTHMIAHVCGLKGGDLVHTLGDAHVYKNHIDALKIQLERTPTAFPTIEFGEGISTIDDFTAEKIILKNYNPQKPIKMEMAV